MLKGLGVGFLVLAACCTDRGSWESIIGFLLLALSCFAFDLYLRCRRKMFKDAVEKEVNRRIYYYKRND